MKNFSQQLAEKVAADHITYHRHQKLMRLLFFPPKKETVERLSQPPQSPQFIYQFPLSVIIA
jgi:hypothetical protein